MKVRVSFPVIAGVALLALAAVFIASCGDDDDAGPGETPPSTTTLPSESPATPTRPATTATRAANRTGNAGIDAVLAAVDARDTATLRSLVQFTKVGCTAQPPLGAGGPPECPPGIADKTAIDVFPASACQGFYSTAERVTPLLQATLDEAPRLVAVYRSTEPGTPVFPSGEVVVLFERTTGAQKGFMTSLGLTTGGRIVTQAGGCAQTPAQRLQERVPAANIILGPFTN